MRIACIGDSITFGAGIVNRERNNWPYHLSCLLGSGYEIGNFGVSGSTLLQKGTLPYRSTKEYRQALDFAAPILMIKLGTNDAFPANWVYGRDFLEDYLELIDSFRARKETQRIILLLPVPNFMKRERTAVRNMEEEIFPLIREAAARRGCEIIDLHSPLWKNPEMFPDGLHPDSRGSEVMARAVYRHLVPHPEKPLTVLAAPSPEYRWKPAGWKRKRSWWEEHESLNRLALKNELDLVFLGDSITQGWMGRGRILGRQGRREARRYYGKRRAASFGISGDKTQNILYRIEQGNFHAVSPRVIVLMMGVNNIILDNDSAEDIIRGIEACIRALERIVPKAEILLLGTFPAGIEKDHPWRQVTDKINHQIKALDRRPRVHVRDLSPHFLDREGRAERRLMSDDGVHLRPRGYRVWAEAIEEDLKLLLGEA